MSASALPPCGLYRTTQPLEGLPPGRLVYFHNHGNPGPGIYLPEGWAHNRANFSGKGVPIPATWWAGTLEPLAPEGFYRVREVFHCCDKHCVEFQADQLVQLGYNGEAEPIVFVPELRPEGFVLPTTGVRIDAGRVHNLAPLKIAVPAATESASSTH